MCRIRGEDKYFVVISDLSLKNFLKMDRTHPGGPRRVAAPDGPRRVGGARALPSPVSYRGTPPQRGEQRRYLRTTLYVYTYIRVQAVQLCTTCTSAASMKVPRYSRVS